MGRRNGRRRTSHGGHDRYLDPATAHICIVGAGLTGLATARQLETYGFCTLPFVNAMSRSMRAA
jgi:NADPH-dependent 2,4-dienoyl-CoA reductase/sulfur reductase-like enzyme